MDKVAADQSMKLQYLFKRLVIPEEITRRDIYFLWIGFHYPIHISRINYVSGVTVTHDSGANRTEGEIKSKLTSANKPFNRSSRSRLRYLGNSWIRLGCIHTERATRFGLSQLRPDFLWTLRLRLASRAEQEKCHGNDRGASRSARYEGSREIGDLSAESVIRVVASSSAVQDFN